MNLKGLISLCLFVICIGVGGFGGVSLLLSLCEQYNAIPGVREYAAGSILGAVLLVLMVSGIEKLFTYARARSKSRRNR